MAPCCRCSSRTAASFPSLRCIRYRCSFLLQLLLTQVSLLSALSICCWCFLQAVSHVIDAVLMPKMEAAAPAAEATAAPAAEPAAPTPAAEPAAAAPAPAAAAATAEAPAAGDFPASCASPVSCKLRFLQACFCWAP